MTMSICVLLVGLAMNAAPATVEADEAANRGAQVSTFDHSGDQPLTDVDFVETIGRQLPLSGDAYGCEFALPKLYLAPHEMAKEARAVSMDHVSCTAVFEVGTPQSVDPLAWRGSEDETNSTGASSRATSSSSGYYIVWWEDPVDLDVNSVKTSIDWEWDGSCATWSQGTANYWWQSWTG